MAELDYQMALLLQHQFEQEFKSVKQAEKSDEQLAKLIQEQYKTEVILETPSTSLVYDKSKKNSGASDKCLIDPSWELIDPTPDIHALFMAFNERFFWNKLLAVCVSWSKRMTLCAGVCSYNGRGGMCCITLSEPLLKLRPRKDLVETLLHEMIHAYLFVTQNNRDRDGHGPEFHKHMYRINRESGTNITVYHDFHDEVRLYQKHWWRCNGPCQYRKPFFGMVRRATNRAPGPNDRWWAEHSRNCGGTFIKVKEPEKQTKSNKKLEKKTNSDIRNFLPSLGSSSTGGGIKEISSSETKTIVKSKSQLDKDNSENKSSSIIDLTKSSDYTNDFLSVRNHWENKFTDTSKRKSTDLLPREVKIAKVSSTPSSSNHVQCPVCNDSISTIELNEHLDNCLTKDKSKEVMDGSSRQETFHKEKKCPLCSVFINEDNFDVHVESCLLKEYNELEKKFGVKLSSEETVPCLACGQSIQKTDLDSHLEDCMSDIFKGDVNENAGENAEYNCPFCLKPVAETEMKEHIDNCLRSADNNLLSSLVGDNF